MTKNPKPLNNTYTSISDPVGNSTAHSNNPLQGLYAITDSSLIADDTLQRSIEHVLRGGARIIQYRDKSNDRAKRISQAGLLKDLCQQYHALLIINDDIQLAIESGADGIHLGKHDTSLIDARCQLGENAIIGISCYNSLDAALDAEKQGANYAAFGAVYRSTTKPEATTVTLETLSEAKSRLSIPICAIGGINRDNAQTVIATGVDMIAVISDLFSHRDIEARSEAFSSLFR